MFLVVHLCVEDSACNDVDSECPSDSDVPPSVKQLKRLYYEQDKDRDSFLNVLQQYVRNYFCNGLLLLMLACNTDI